MAKKKKTLRKKQISKTTKKKTALKRRPGPQKFEVKPGLYIYTNDVIEAIQQMEYLDDIEAVIDTAVNKRDGIEEMEEEDKVFSIDDLYEDEDYKKLCKLTDNLSDRYTFKNKETGIGDVTVYFETDWIGGEIEIGINEIDINCLKNKDKWGPHFNSIISSQTHVLSYLSIYDDIQEGLRKYYKTREMLDLIDNLYDKFRDVEYDLEDEIYKLVTN